MSLIPSRPVCEFDLSVIEEAIRLGEGVLGNMIEFRGARIAVERIRAQILPIHGTEQPR